MAFLHDGRSMIGYPEYNVAHPKLEPMGKVGWLVFAGTLGVQAYRIYKEWKVRSDVIRRLEEEEEEGAIAQAVPVAARDATTPAPAKTRPTDAWASTDTDNDLPLLHSSAMPVAPVAEKPSVVAADAVAVADAVADADADADAAAAASPSTASPAESSVVTPAPASTASDGAVVAAAPPAAASSPSTAPVDESPIVADADDGDDPTTTTIVTAPQTSTAVAVAAPAEVVSSKPKRASNVVEDPNGPCASAVWMPIVLKHFKKCSNCSAPGASKRCRSCQSVSYCSGDHQASDWRRHKPECAHLKEAKDQSFDDFDFLVANWSSGDTRAAQDRALTACLSRLVLRNFDDDVTHMCTLLARLGKCMLFKVTSSAPQNQMGQLPPGDLRDQIIDAVKLTKHAIRTLKRFAPDDFEAYQCLLYHNMSDLLAVKGDVPQYRKYSRLCMISFIDVMSAPDPLSEKLPGKSSKERRGNLQRLFAQIFPSIVSQYLDLDLTDEAMLLLQELPRRSQHELIVPFVQSVVQMGNDLYSAWMSVERPPGPSFTWPPADRERVTREFQVAAATMAASQAQARTLNANMQSETLEE